ncbi:HD domain-containing phosphohydrolase [Butyrivibrio sp. MC2021]|uniref:HD domain-containing phosphohydrolase n=1 Tax=Butyrivibrio sp. MC2021 TaxID=1408306 RepID=UPI000685C2B4|nr:HD domain-containing phosphohydrolase [Butyrivibrio sp. MC2021]
MRISKLLNTFFMYCSVLIILITAYYAEKVASENRVDSLVEADISLTGARLSDELYGSVRKTGEWRKNGGTSNQLEFTIKNLGKSGITNWKLLLKVPEDATVDSQWNVEVSNESLGDYLMFTPGQFNSTIESGDTMEFGAVINSKKELDPNNLHIIGYMVLSRNSFIKNSIIFMMIIWLVVFVGYLVTKFNLKNYQERQKNDVRIILQSMNTFISFIDAKDPYTRGHSRRVAMYAAEIAKRMGLPESEVQNIYYAGLLHDAGKISVPDAVLNKPGKLTDEERKTIQSHTVAGGKMLKQLSSIKGIRETALYHHERYDGTGYPEGLQGENIPLYARIVGVADSYDAMSSNRVYRRHLNKDEIIEEIQQGAGTQFDPDILKYMVDMINDGYVNVVKMETAENEDGTNDIHIHEEDLPGFYLS